LQVQILTNEAHGHYRLGDTREAELLAVNSTGIRYQDGDGHLLGLHFVLRLLELEHALIAEINFFLLRLVGKGDAGDEWPSWFGLNVEQEVAF
jgi:hypothetical protein